MSASRIHGRGRLLYSLEALRRRVLKFIQFRAANAEEIQWGGQLAEALEGAYNQAAAAPGAQRGLEAGRERRRLSRKSLRGFQ